MKKITLFGVATIMALSFGMTAFAETSTVPVRATQTPIKMNIRVSEAINISLDRNTVDATVTDLVVENLGTVGNVKITKIAVTDSADYEKVADTEDFATMPMNTKKYSLVHNTHDFSAGDATVEYIINPASNKAIEFTSKVAPSLVEVPSTEIAAATLTIGLDAASSTL